MTKPSVQKDFALAPGGPVDRVQGWLHITSPPDSLRLGRRALFAALIAWVPLAVMLLLRPAPTADIPFLYDIAAHVRFLLIVPLLIIAEGTIRTRSHMVVQTLRTSGLVSEDDMPRYEATVRLGRRLIDSTVAELVVIALSAALVWAAIHGVMAESAVYWFEQDANGNLLSNAGWWYAAVATPLFVFLLLRWAWRYLVWWWFLGRVARLDLRLTGTHPDRVGGLGFIMFNHAVFASVTFAVGCAVSAAAANRILYADATLKSFQWPLIGITVFAILFGIAPMLVFTVPLVMAKRKAWLEYSAFASNYVSAFEEKWLQGKTDEEALGTGDIQSLADLGGSFERMVQMRTMAVDRRLIVVFLIAAVAPALPLALTVMPLKEIVRILFKAMM